MEKKDKRFDDLMRDKLEGLELPYQPDAWLLFEQKLDERGMGDSPGGLPATDAKGMDEAVFNKLHRYEAPYQPVHWLRMEALLEEVFILPRAILRYKLAESALMLLLFAALWQLAPSAPPTDHGDRQAHHPGALALPTESHPQPAFIAPAEAPSSLEPGQLATDLEPTPEHGSAAPLTSKPASPASSHQTTQNAPLPGYPASPRQSDPFAINELKPLALHPLKSQASWHQRSVAGHLPALTSQPSVAVTPPIPKRQPTLLADTPSQADFSPLRPHKPQSIFRVGMFGSTDYNHIMVPANEERRLFQGFDRHALGYGGGLSLSIELSRRWELEMAAVYAARQYPVGIIYVEGSLSHGLQGSELRATELNMINLPFHLRYNYVHRSNWRAYALTGVAVQVVFQSNYYAAEAPEFDYRPIMIPLEPAPGEENIITQFRSEGLAWFEGGTFKENAYFTANFGLGLERYVGTRWSVFAQPTLQYSIYYLNGGLGPNKDQINSLSVLFGTKVRLY